MLQSRQFFRIRGRRNRRFISVYNLRSASGPRSQCSLSTVQTQHAKSKEASRFPADTFGCFRAWSNQLPAELCSLINIWIDWRRLHKREKGHHYEQLVPGKNRVLTESKMAHSGPALLLLVMCSTQRHLTHPCVHLNLSRRVPYKHFCSHWGVEVLLPQYFFCEALCKMNATIPSGSYLGQKL